jgi:hypothetical protein
LKIKFWYIKISFYLESALFGANCFGALFAVVSEKIMKKSPDEPKKPEEKREILLILMKNLRQSLMKFL